MVKQLATDDASANDYNRPGTLWATVIAFIVSIGFISFGDGGDLAWYIAGASVLLTIQYMIAAILKGKRHILSAQAPEQIVRLGSLLIMILYQVFIIESYSLLSIVKAIFYAGVLSCMASIYLLIRKENLKVVFRRSSAFSIFRTEVFFFAALALFGVFRHKLDVLMLGWNELFTETGIYNISSKLSDLILIGLVLTNALYMPLFAAQKDTSDRIELAKVLKSSSILNMILGGMFLLTYIVFGKFILGFFGDGFEAGYWSLIILSISTFLYAVLGPYIVMLMMVGHARDVLIGLVLGVGLQFALALLLIDDTPIMGMAMAKGISIVFIQIFMMIVAWKRLGLKPYFLLLRNRDN